MRIGHGFDAHRLTENRALVLGGVKIPFEKGLLGHSDADVLLHAIMDSLLGAASLGDIGKHFPPSDDAYKDINSMLLLRKTAELIRSNGYSVINVDSTILAQKPHLANFIPKMRENIADALGIDTDCVSVKATTTEGMGYEGRSEGISAHAVCLISR